MKGPLGGSEYAAVLPTPLPGAPALGVRMQQGRVVAIELVGPAQRPSQTHAGEASEVASWLQHYFSHARAGAPPVLQPGGTAFQRRVWRRLQDIPCGQVMTYGALAQELGSSARAVAGACRANPIPIVIPCHRVVAADGPGGYMGKSGGPALAIKRWLLQHEGHV